jgi:hypothetical protein
MFFRHRSIELYHNLLYDRNYFVIKSGTVNKYQEPGLTELVAAV